MASDSLSRWKAQLDKEELTQRGPDGDGKPEDFGDFDEDTRKLADGEIVPKTVDDQVL